MEKIRFNQILIYSITFVIGIALVISAGYYRKSLPKETGAFKVNLSAGEEETGIKPVIYDVQNQGLAKTIFQPGRIAIATGHAGGVANKGNAPLWLKVKTEGFIGDTEVTSVNPSFDKQTESFTEPIQPGKSVSVDVDLDIPRSELSKGYLISSGNIILEDSRSGKLLAKIPVKIVDSKFSQKS